LGTSKSIRVNNDRESKLEKSLQKSESLLELVGISIGEDVVQLGQQDVGVNFLAFEFEKGGRRDAKCSSQTLDDVDGWPLLTSLNFSEIIGIDIGSLGYEFS